MNLAQLAERIALPLPGEYRSFVMEVGAERLEGTLASPAAVCAVNLEAREKVPSQISRSAFFVFETDTGDLLLLSDGVDGATAVRMWTFETGEIVDRPESPANLLEQLASSALPTLPKDAGIFVLSKITPWPLSILDPITLAELHEESAKLRGVAAVKLAEGFGEYSRVGYNKAGRSRDCRAR